jgi:uncharacterized damage-inducible protein DinB
VKKVTRRSRKSIRITPEIRAYVRKIDGYRAGRAPMPLLKTGPAKIARAVRGLSRSQLRKRPAPGKWSVVEILGHLLDTEFVYGYRWRLTAGQPRSPIPGYDQAAWARELRYDRADAKRLVEGIQELRRHNLEFVSRIPRARRKRYGMHSERGRESLERSLQLIAGHDLNHLDQIRAIRKKYGW